MKPPRFLFAFLLALLIAGCGGSGTISADRAKTVKVGTASNYPPIAFVEQGDLKGIEPDLARELVRETGMRVTVKPMQWEQLIPALQQGKIDVIMAGMSITPERARQVSFVEPYMQVGQMVLIREQDVARLAPLGALATPGRRIGVVRTTTGEQLVRARFTQAEVVTFSGTDEGVQALSAGRIDYFVHDAPAIWRYGVSAGPNSGGLIGLYNPLSEEYLAWAVRKNDTALKARLDQAVRNLKSRGVVDKVMNRWIKTRVEVAPLQSRP